MLSSIALFTSPTIVLRPPLPPPHARVHTLEDTRPGAGGRQWRGSEGRGAQVIPPNKIQAQRDALDPPRRRKHPLEAILKDHVCCLVEPPQHTLSTRTRSQHSRSKKSKKLKRTHDNDAAIVRHDGHLLCGCISPRRRAPPSLSPSLPLSLSLSAHAHVHAHKHNNKSRRMEGEGREGRRGEGRRTVDVGLQVHGLVKLVKGFDKFANFFLGDHPSASPQ